MMLLSEPQLNVFAYLFLAKSSANIEPFRGDLQ